MTSDMNPLDSDRLELLDRVADRLPEVNLEEHEIAWTRLEDGHEALLGAGFDGGSGCFLANAGSDLHVIGSLAPIVDGIGCVVIRPDGSRYLARAVPDPLAE